MRRSNFALGRLSKPIGLSYYEHDRVAEQRGLPNVFRKQTNLCAASELLDYRNSS